MPIYEFECAGCGERYETLRTGAGEEAPTCPRCGGRQARRLPSPFAVIGRAGPGLRPEAAGAEWAGGAAGCGADDCACRLD